MKRVLLILVLLAAPLSFARAQEGTQVAVAAGIHGTVQIAKADFAPSDRSIGTQLGSGAPIYSGDEISTGPDSGLQVILLDQTIITLGQNGRMVVDELTFSPQSADGKLALNIKDGAFRFTTGKIAQANPDNVSVKVPLASVGIRGTIFGGGPSEAGKPASNGYFVMLLGPGPDNNTVPRTVPSTLPAKAQPKASTAPVLPWTCNPISPPAPRTWRHPSSFKP